MIKKSVAERIEQVQSPVIPIVGDWVKASPGTLSLGQGVVFYPPPKPISSSRKTYWVTNVIIKICKMTLSQNRIL